MLDTDSVLHAPKLVADGPTVPPIFAEAILGAIYGVLYEQVTTVGPEQLPRTAPLLTYLALAPFVGADRACTEATLPVSSGWKLKRETDA